MSIIERAAALLRPTPHGESSTSVPTEKGDVRRPGLIERAASDLAQAAGRPAEAQRPSELPKTTPLARATGEATRHFAVDRSRLRSLSLITPDGERTPLAESFRRVKRQILAKAANPSPGAPPANFVLVTSAMPGEGKTYCAINLAISIALELERAVLLVDADVAKPRIPQALGLHAEGGLMELLLDRGAGWNDVLWHTDIGGLTVLPAGLPHRHATELLASETMGSLLRDMAERYADGIVVFDSPPLLAASEAGVLATHVGQIVVVVEASSTSEASLKRALGMIDAGRITGLLLNKVESTPLEHGYDDYGY